MTVDEAVSDEAASPLVIGDHLPGVMQADPFLGRFVSGLDEVLAPCALAVHGADAGIDWRLCPSSVRRWLAGWIGLPVDETMPDAMVRKLLDHRVELLDRRGTAGALRLALGIVTERAVTVTDSGFTTASGGPAREGGGPPSVVVSIAGIEALDGEARNQARNRVSCVLRMFVPAHVMIKLDPPVP